MPGEIFADKQTRNLTTMDNFHRRQTVAEKPNKSIMQTLNPHMFDQLQPILEDENGFANMNKTQIISNYNKVRSNSLTKLSKYIKFKDGELNEHNQTSVKRKSTLYDESNYVQTPGTIRNKS